MEFPFCCILGRSLLRQSRGLLGVVVGILRQPVSEPCREGCSLRDESGGGWASFDSCAIRPLGHPSISA